MGQNESGALNICLGSGDRPIEGYVNVDMNPNAPKVDVVHDLDRFPWPFESNSADHIVMEHCLEHLTDHCRAMKELHRILKPPLGNVHGEGVAIDNLDILFILVTGCRGKFDRAEADVALFGRQGG